MEEFSEKLRMAFGPPCPLLWENILQIFPEIHDQNFAWISTKFAMIFLKFTNFGGDRRPFDHWNHRNSGFQSLTEELNQMNVDGHGDVDGRKERLYHLQNLVSNSIEMKEEKLSSMQKKYDRYKESYAKFLRFNPAYKSTSYSRFLFSHK